jgi:hypothetical protein
MNSDHDLDRQLDAFLRRGPSDLPDASFDAVRDLIDQTGQRVVIGPWRIADTMSKFVTLGLGAAAVVVALLIGAQLLGPAAPGGVGGAPSAEPTPMAVGGTVEYVMDGAPTTTAIDAVADGASVTGTAITTSRRGMHTVRLQCAAHDGDTWAVGGTVEETTLPGESAGLWSAVIVKDGSPQQIAIWLSVPMDCETLPGAEVSDLGAENFVAVTSGELVAPPDLAP